MTATPLPSGIDNSDYIAFGLAHCFTMDDGHLEDYWIMEPLTGATLECIRKVTKNHDFIRNSKLVEA
jgi:hypothetical protein